MVKSEQSSSQFFVLNSAKNTVKYKNCFKGNTNPLCIDLLITNNPFNFRNTCN